MTSTKPAPSLQDRAMRAFARAAISVHTFLYRQTNGAFGGKMGPNKILLLTTIGRRTGKQHTWPLVFFQDNKQIMVVASNGGADRHPAWFLNLQQHPRATIQIGGTQTKVRAQAASGAERDQLWRVIISQGPQFANYQTNTKREIPVVVLTPEV
ncbi:MAG: nitroreductase family deazaflavin-dependent oxidoreductase [Roseiflexaceae bacterium]|nr:nitroreductase family deazaflavin-dependent oxidoreductase [Roseiflexaceae bacterium]